MLNGKIHSIETKKSIEMENRMLCLFSFSKMQIHVTIGWAFHFLKPRHVHFDQF